MLRVASAGSVALYLSLPLVTLGGGCDGASSTPATVQESPQEARDRQKTIEDAYKSSPPDSAKRSSAKK
jgi:hypothetical protein